MDTRTPSRRLSVPSGTTPFQYGQAQMPGRGPGPMLVNSSNAGALSSPNANLVSSPTISTSGFSGRRDSVASSIGDDSWRRRTWHPDSRSFGGTAQLNAVLSQSVRPNPPPPIANPSNPQSNLRLPGIESFDPLPRSATPPRRNGSPMTVDSELAHRPPVMEAIQPDERRNLNMYDVSLQRGLGRLDIGHKTPPRDSAGMWASEVHKAVQNQMDHARMNQPTVRFEEQPRPSHQVPPPAVSSRSFHQHTMSAPALASVREGKGHGWYQGPSAATHGTNQDARNPHVDRMVHPNFTGFAGFPAREQAQEQRPPQTQVHYHQQPPPPYQQQSQHQQQQQQQSHYQQQRQQQDRSNNPDSLRRLEALVAVATSEGSNTAAAY